MTTPETSGRFSLTLSPEQRAYLLELARRSIQTVFDGRDVIPDAPADAVLREAYGAFVTLKINGRLRGCIGSLTGAAPLYETIWSMARSAAFADPRFAPLTSREAAAMDIEISVLSPLARCANPAEIQIGRDGLLLRKGTRQGVFLPQVPVEWHWDLPTYLTQLCHKAGLPPGAWKDADAQLYTFEAVVFGEEESAHQG